MGSPSLTPLVPGRWFQLSGVFPGNASAVYSLNIDCRLPTDYVCCGDPVRVWYVDDVTIR